MVYWGLAVASVLSVLATTCKHLSWAKNENSFDIEPKKETVNSEPEQKPVASFWPPPTNQDPFEM